MAVPRASIVAWLSAAAATTACASLPEFDTHVRITTSLDPDRAAWLIADLVRSRVPGADPLPQHAGSPVLRRPTRRYVVCYAGDRHGAVRAWMNGRLLPPQPNAGSTAGWRFPAPAFVTREVTTHASARQGRQVWHLHAEIRGGAQGTRVELEALGAGAQAVLAEVGPLLAAAEAIFLADDRLRTGRYTDADLVAAHGLERLATVRSDGASRVRAALLTRRARAALARARSRAALRLLDRAVRADPRRHDLRLLRAAVAWRDGRLEALDELRGLAGTPAGDGTAAVARSWLAARYRAATGGLRLARALLRAGLPGAAARWAAGTSTAAPPSPAARRLLIVAHLRRGEARRAYDEALAEFQRRGDHPDVLLALHDACLALGRAPSALLWLARHADVLQRSRPTEWAARLDAARRRLGPDRVRSALELVRRGWGSRSHGMVTWPELSGLLEGPRTPLPASAPR